MTGRVLLAGAAGEAAGRHHQRDMFAPAIGASDLLEVCGVWPGPVGAEGFGRAALLADDLGVPLVRDSVAALAAADAVVACLDPDSLCELLGAAPVGAPALPVLVDKLVLFGTARLGTLAQDPSAGAVVAAYHSRFHPSVAGLAALVASGELGLPHAAHGELVVAYGDGPAAEGDLRHVGVLALDVLAAIVGPPTGSVHAVRTATGDPATEGWTLTVRWHPGIVVTLIVSRLQPGTTGSLHRYRVLGSEGQALADLAAPRLSLVGGPDVPYGPGPVQLELESLAFGARGTTLTDLTRLSRLIDAAERSAADGNVQPYA
ncbi:MAG: hypothetical protein M3Y71_18325 [Actinomycetota bacterium]|uniref:hypothetical protein n=1 Tax=Lapillicoccus sp. TaxID=1909287 RepID=UPI0027CD208B|nr:hypothetical protein [Actinomycetota bacterium]